MPSYRPRLWFSFSMSVLAVGLPTMARAADPACTSLAPVSLGEGGEAGEGGGEGGAVTPVNRALLLDRMAAQIEGAAERRAAGDADSAEILDAAATDEGPARLAHRGGGSDAALEAALAPLIGAPTDPAARADAQWAIEAALTRWPESASPAGRMERAAGLASLALGAFSAAFACGTVGDRAAYAEAHALVQRARRLAAALPGEAAREVSAGLERLGGLLPATPPVIAPDLGEVSALVSGIVLAASDVSH